MADEKSFIQDAAGSQVYAPRDAEDFGRAKVLTGSTITAQDQGSQSAQSLNEMLKPDVCRAKSLEDYNAAVDAWNQFHSGMFEGVIPVSGTACPSSMKLDESKTPPRCYSKYHLQHMTPGQWMTQRDQCSTGIVIQGPKYGCPPGQKRVGGMCLPPLDPMRFRRGR